MGIVGLLRSCIVIHRMKTPGPLDLGSRAEIDSPHQCGNPKSKVDKNGGESHTNLLGDTRQMLNGSEVWDMF